MTAAWLAGAGALLLLAVVAIVLRRRRDGTVGEPEEALVAAERALPGFVGVAVLVAADARSALVSGENGRLAVLKVSRTRVAAREIGWPAVRASAGGVVVETGERRFGRVPLTGVDQLDVRRLAPPDAARRFARTG